MCSNESNKIGRTHGEDTKQNVVCGDASWETSAADNAMLVTICPTMAAINNQSFNSSIWGPLRCRVGLRRILLLTKARYLKWRKLSWQSSSCPLSEKTSPIDYSNEEGNCLHLKNYLKIYDPGLYVKMEGHLHSKVGRHFKSKQVSIAVAIVNT